MDTTREQLRIKLFADGADLENMIEMASKPFIAGLTTNPTLMRKAGVKNYSKFAKSVLNEIKDKPISFEVFSDDVQEMTLQGLKISSWAENVYVKIPVTNTKGESTAPAIRELTSTGVKVNVTALMTPLQVEQVIEVLNPDVPSNISVFAGRIADTGVDPITIMKQSLEVMTEIPNAELIWASPRELLNVFQADSIGCHIITATSDILKKLSLVGYDLLSYSQDTVKMFHEDAKNAGYVI
jgi:transaldolase